MRTLSFDADRLNRLGPWMDRWVGSGRLPGAQVLIHHRGQEAWAGHTGLRDREHARPWERDTIARIYSMTKPVTSVALLMLYEDGLCHLDMPVDEILPEFATPMVLRPGAASLDEADPARTRLTLHHLLTHTSGLTYGFNEGLVSAAMTERRIGFTPSQGPLEESVRQLSELPLLFEPGSRWNYGVSTDVLGRVVEVVSGKSLSEVFAERIFGPLEMHDTGFEVAADKESRFAACYTKTDADPLLLFDTGPGTAFGAGKVRQFSGGGGLVSTADDYTRFARMLLGGGAFGDVRLLSPRTVQVMTSNALPGDLASMGQAVFSEVPFDGIGFGLGVSVTLEPARAKTLASPGDFGWGGLASTVFWADPVEDLSVVFLTQLIPSSAYPIRKELRALVYSSLV